MIKPTLKRPGRTAVTSIAYNKDGGLIAGGLEDGSVQLWDIRTKSHQTKKHSGTVAASAFQSMNKGKKNWTTLSRCRHRVSDTPGTTCLRFGTRNPNLLLSRNESSGTLKLWDVRKFGTNPSSSASPVAEVINLPIGNVPVGNTQCCFSPSEELVLCAVGATQHADGYIGVYDATRDLEFVRRIGGESNPGSVIPLLWHGKLNQILYGCGDRKQGGGRVLFDVENSLRGMVGVAGRRVVEKDVGVVRVDLQEKEIMEGGEVKIVGGRLVSGGAGGWKKREVEGGGDVSKSARKLAKLFQPKTAKESQSKEKVFGKGGEIGVGTHSSLLTQYLLKNQGVLKPPAEEDVRASILRHAGEGEAQMKGLTAAYQDTQPNKIYRNDEEEEEEEEEEEGRKRR